MVVTRSQARQAPVPTMQLFLEQAAAMQTAQALKTAAALWPRLAVPDRSLVRIQLERSMRGRAVLVSTLDHEVVFGTPSLPEPAGEMTAGEISYVTQLLSDVEKSEGWSEQLEHVQDMFDFIIVERRILHRVGRTPFRRGFNFAQAVMAKYDEFCGHKMPEVGQQLRARYGSLIDQVRLVTKPAPPAPRYNLRPRVVRKKPSCILCRAE